MKSSGNSRLPEGWGDARVADVITHYETQPEDEAVAEDEAALSDPGQTVMVIPTRLVPAVRKLLASTGTYSSMLRTAIEQYRFPTVTYDFRKGRELCHRDMAAVEMYIGKRLRARESETVKEGLANVLYWGYANSPGRRVHRVEEFLQNATEKMVDDFISATESQETPGLFDIKKIGLPQFSGMSFVTKIVMFLNPDRHPVLDMKVAESFSQTLEFPPLQDLVFRKRADFGKKADTQIKITRRNECVYGKWASWCRDIATSVNAESGSSGKSVRAVDVERAVFALADACDRTEAWMLLRGPCDEGRAGRVRDDDETAE
ncbi:MAG: hypothetical protein F4X11_23195 [Acidobacteria bacterium]|nr:hypothetical protein [Acidobacteriota bacterium]